MRIRVTDPIHPGDYELTLVTGTPAPVPLPEPPPPVEEPVPEEPPPPPAPPPIEAVTEVWTSGGSIGFTFQGPAVVGQFVNGDWWCLPCTVASVFPGWSAGRGGSMVNPRHVSNSTSARHGFDDRVPNFGAAYRTTFPRALSPGDSLVVTSSWRPGEAGAPAVDGTNTDTTRPTIRHAAVLSCVVEPPPSGSFRKPYAGTGKPTIVADEIGLDGLPNWPLPTGAPSIASVVDQISRLWLDPMTQSNGRLLHPSENMRDYGRDFCADLGDAMLLLLCNIPLADKMALAIRLCQIGIDQRAVLDSGAEWGEDGGSHGVGRRMPVILTGYLLGRTEFLNYFVGRDIAASQESAQVARDAAGLYWRERPGNTRALPGKVSYRKLATPAWMPHFLVARALGLETEWAHADAGEFQDAYQNETLTFWYHYSIKPWHKTLWETTDGGRHAP